MRAIRLIALAAALCAPNLFAAQIFLLDFGGANITGTGAAPNDPVNVWNNIPTAVTQTDSGVFGSTLVAVDNSPSTIGLAMVSRFNGVNEDGRQDSTLFPTNATRDSLYGNTGAFNNLTNIFPRLKLTNLSPTDTYTLTFYASRNGVTDNRETRYEVVGLTTQEAFLNASNNTNETAIVSGILASGANEIGINITPGPNNNNGATRFTYLGVLKIEVTPIPEPSSALMIAAGLGAVWLRRRTVG